MKIIGMIPARIGSQRVKKKNLRLLHKRPLIDYILEAASKVEIFDHIYLNSDDEIFAELCEPYGITYYKRPQKFATDTSTNDENRINLPQNLILGDSVRIFGMNTTAIIKEILPENKFRLLLGKVIIELPGERIIKIDNLSENKEKDNRLEIVDGSQRIRTLAAFISNELTLIGLEKLDKLNSFSFSDLSSSRQRKFKNTPLRMIVLSDKATEDVRNEIFERINRGSDLLLAMEKRKGIYRGAFRDFIYDVCGKNKTFHKITKVDARQDKRQENLHCYSC